MLVLLLGIFVALLDPEVIAGYKPPKRPNVYSAYSCLFSILCRQMDQMAYAQDLFIQAAAPFDVAMGIGQ